MKDGYKICPRCCPAGRSLTNRHEKTWGADGHPAWRCLNCSNELPRRIRRTKDQIEAIEARAALGIAPDDASLDALLAIVDYGARKAAGVPLTGELSLADLIRLGNHDAR